MKGWEVVAEADNGKDAIALAVEKSPNVAIVDYSLPLINGIEVTRNIKVAPVDTEVLIFTMHDSDMLVSEAFQGRRQGISAEVRRQATSHGRRRSHC